MMIDLNNIKEFKPILELNDLLFSVIEINSSFESVCFEIYPDGCDYLIISSRGNYYFIRKQQTTYSLESHDERLFIVRFKPYTLYSLEKYHSSLNEALHILSVAIFSTNSILNKQYYVYYELFRFFNELSSDELKLVVSLCDLVYENKGDIKLGEFEKIYDCSLRTIQRNFKKYTNITLKEYAQINKFQANITKLKKIELKNGKVPKCFSNYSHYFKVIKKYTSLSPKSFYDLEHSCPKSIFEIF